MLILPGKVDEGKGTKESHSWFQKTGRNTELQKSLDILGKMKVYYKHTQI